MEHRALDLVPATAPKIDGATLAAVYYGQRQGGDFYDFFRLSERRICLGLFDVAGQLEQARPLALAVQRKFRSSTPELLASSSGNEADTMLGLWLALNQTLMASAGRVHPCPAFLGCYNEDLSSLCYVNAGHTSGLIRYQDGIRELHSTALPLGLFSHSVPDCSMFRLQAGDAMVLVSRGVVEAHDRREEYGIERAKQYLDESRALSARELCLGILSKVRQFMKTTPTHNDVTALALVRFQSESRPA
ncbi:MAG: SpoIIE family protein phosphatase [Acidobacteria bacterium]|nr:SpoIIE family protein phosphatase [Acidobacteriota bacterium]